MLFRGKFGQNYAIFCDSVGWEVMKSSAGKQLLLVRGVPMGSLVALTCICSRKRYHLINGNIFLFA